MINYETWKTLNESHFNLGLKGYPVVSGIVGNHLGIQEAGFPHDDDDLDDEDEDEDDDLDDEDDEDDDEEPKFGKKKDDDLEGDLFGASKEEGPKKGFPPDDSEDMDSPSDELEGLEGLEDGEDGEGLEGLEDGEGLEGLEGGKGPEGEDDVDMDKILGDVDPTLAFGADSGMTKLGDQESDGFDDLMGGEEGDSPEMGGEPCPECNPDGSEEGDPECPSCHGTGFMDAETGDDSDFGDDLEGLGDDMDDDIGADSHKGAEHMAAGPVKVFNITHHHHHGHTGSGSNDPISSIKHMSAGCNSCESNIGCVDETESDFFANLTKQAMGEPRNKKYSSGLKEDSLFTQVKSVKEPSPGKVGFAPQGRIGDVGGGYTQADISDIPVMESRKYLTLEQFVAKKAAAKKKNGKK